MKVVMVAFLARWAEILILLAIKNKGKNERKRTGLDRFFDAGIATERPEDSCVILVLEVNAPSFEEKPKLNRKTI